MRRMERRTNQPRRRAFGFDLARLLSVGGKQAVQRVSVASAHPQPLAQALSSVQPHLRQVPRIGFPGFADVCTGATWSRIFGIGPGSSGDSAAALLLFLDIDSSLGSDSR